MIHVVLFRSIYPRNVGMCARAMANMGLEQLIVVAPRCSLSEEKAKQGAAHAQEVLKNARIYATLAEFQAAEGEGVRIALSGKDAKLKRSENLNDALAGLAADREHPFHAASTPVYLLFGPEDDGLSNEEMELSHHICRLPTFGEITSLNLSHAVLLTAYLVRVARDATLTAGTKAGARELKEGPVAYPSVTIKRWLEALGFDLSAPRVTIEKTLNRIFLSSCPGTEELRIVESVLQQTVRKLEQK